MSSTPDTPSHTLRGGHFLTRDERGENSIMQVISIAVSAILIVSGLMTAPGLIQSARDTNAKKDVVNLAEGTELYSAMAGRLPTDVSQILDTDVTGRKITLSDGTKAHVVPNGSDWCLSVRSLSGKWFARSGESTKIHSGNSMKGSMSQIGCEGMETDQLADWSNWTLSGGAYIDGNELVLPSVDSWARSPLVWAKPYETSRLQFDINAPTGGDDRFLTGAGYLGADQVTPVKNGGGWTTNGNSVKTVSGRWHTDASLVGLVTGEVEWVYYTLGIQYNYGVPGTRYRDVSVTFNGSK